MSVIDSGRSSPVPPARGAAQLRQPRTWPIAHLLVLFAVIQALPFIAVVVHEVVRVEENERATFRARLQDAAEEIANGIDISLARYIERLKTLASSPALQRKDYKTAHAQARAALELDGIYVFLREPDGRQLFNTRVPFDGKALPARASSTPFDARELHRVSDVVHSSLANKQIIEISVPVGPDGPEPNVLSLSIELSLFNKLLYELRAGLKDPPKKGRMMLSDGQRQIIADSQDPSTPPLDSGRQASAANKQLSLATTWSVDVRAPLAISARLREALLWRYGPFVGMAALFGLAGAWWLGRLISRPIAEAARAAKALGDGTFVQITPCAVQEANAVSIALQNASDQRRKVETSLRERQEQLKAARTAAGVAAFQLDIATDRIIWSSQAEQLFGVPAEAIATGSGFLSFLRPAEGQRLQNTNKLLFGQGGPFQTGAVRFGSPDGADRWIILRGLVDLDPAGKAINVIGACVDITARKLEEGHARRWQGVFEDADFGLAHVSATDDTFLEVNSAFARERGYLPQEFRNRSLLTDVSPEFYESMQHQLRLIDQTGHQAFETRHLRRDGTSFPVFMEVTVIKDDSGRPISRVIYARNIADLKQAEEKLLNSQKALHHRMQNLLLVVQEVVLKSAKTILTPEDFNTLEEGVIPRMEALSALHILLLEGGSKEVAMADLIRTILKPFLDNDKRLDAQGPSLVLMRGAAQDLSLALHELATNAAKYGALNRHAVAGKVVIRWEIVTDADGAGRVQLSWTEVGGGKVIAPQRTGYGHSMLTKVMEHYGKVTLEFKSSGLEWHFDAAAGVSFRAERLDSQLVHSSVNGHSP
jgi:PAS domain S-box-containing protein